MVITIDGPAGAGKSTVARTLARRLAFRFLDTGAMYRAVALAALKRGLAWEDTAALSALVPRLAIEVTEQAVRLDGQDVTEAIRAMEITSVVHHVADNVKVREHLVQLQRQIAEAGNYVTEGRDQGTVVFPNAQCKIFLTASREERARRRMADLVARGAKATLEEVLELQEERDERDRNRKVGRLVPAADAIEVSTDGMSPEEVVGHVEQIVRRALAMPRGDG
jgi:cytidylate kinase